MEKNNIINSILKKHRFSRYFELIIGILLCAVAFNLFLLPNNIVFGGVSGLSIIFTNYVEMNPSIFILLISLVLLGVSFIFLGVKQTKASIVGSILFPVFVSLTENIGSLIPINTNDQLLLAVFGGLIYGFGAGLVFKAGFTTGGTDILNQIMQKYAKVSLGTSMIIIDGAIVLFGGFIFGWTKFMYAAIVLYIISLMTDKVMLGISDCKAFYVITTKREEVEEFVINELGHAVTVMDAKGGFTNKKNPVLFTVIPTKEYFKFKEGLEYIDKDAFFTVIDAYEVMGGE